MRTHPIGRAVVMALTTLLAACGDDGPSGVGNEGDVVGGPCEGSGDCADGSECLSDGDFPGGMCTVACSSDADCPEGSLCVSSDGGTCLLPCNDDADCRDGYECDDRSREEGDGTVDVCDGGA